MDNDDKIYPNPIVVENLIACANVVDAEDELLAQEVERYNDLSAEVDQLNSQIKELQRTKLESDVLINYQLQIDSYIEKKELLRLNSNDFQTYSRKTEDITAICDDANSIKQRISDYLRIIDSQIDSEVGKFNNLNAEVDSLKMQLQAVASENAVEKEKELTLSLEISKMDVEINHLRSIVYKIEEENQNMKKERDDIMLQRQEMEKTLLKLEESKDYLSKKSLKINTTFEEKQMKFDTEALQKIVDNEEKLINDTKEKYDAINREILVAQDSIDKASKELVQIVDENCKAKLKHDFLIQRINAMGGIDEIIEHKKSHQKNQIQTTKEIEGDIKKMDEKLTDAKMSIQTLEDQGVSLNKDKMLLDEKSIELCNTITLQEAELESLQLQKNEIDKAIIEGNIVRQKNVEEMDTLYNDKTNLQKQKLDVEHCHRKTCFGILGLSGMEEENVSKTVADIAIEQNDKLSDLEKQLEVAIKDGERDDDILRGANAECNVLMNKAAKLEAQLDALRTLQMERMRSADEASDGSADGAMHFNEFLRKSNLKRGNNR